ncbi:hypothetical protein CHARACLAT_004969 [Characodon lateralis]|uniref:Uncharacterized protein n=1 Tax=Characodon lateralis TaxID=208331 RepID=A0ABU7EGQ2_9TELE|nr:hypothetical protein [Characodon lateralis]
MESGSERPCACAGRIFFPSFPLPHLRRAIPVRSQLFPRMTAPILKGAHREVCLSEKGCFSFLLFFFNGQLFSSCSLLPITHRPSLWPVLSMILEAEEEEEGEERRVMMSTALVLR